MGKAIKLRYELEVKARRMLTDGKAPYEVAKALGVDLPPVSQIYREMLAVARRSLEVEADLMVRAIQNAVVSWHDNLIDDGLITEVECPFCKTRSDYTDDWSHRQHKHRPDCLVVNARKIISIIEGTRA